jgi:hypothetical protein
VCGEAMVLTEQRNGGEGGRTAPIAGEGGDGRNWEFLGQMANSSSGVSNAAQK